MLLFMSHILLCNTAYDTKIYIEKYQFIYNNNDVTDNFLCCAFMSILNPYDNSPFIRKFTNLCDVTYSQKSTLNFCEVFIAYSMDMFFEPGHFYQNLFRDKSIIDEIDRKFSKYVKSMHKKYTKVDYVQGVQVLVYTFVKSVFKNMEEKKRFLDAYVNRCKYLYNEQMATLLKRYRNITYDQCLHGSRNVNIDSSVFQCVECTKGTSYIRNSFDYKLLLMLMTTIEQEKNSRIAETMTHTVWEELKDTNSLLLANQSPPIIETMGDISVFIDFTPHDMEFIERATPILCKKIDLEQKRTLIIQEINILTHKCLQTLSKCAMVLTNKEKLRIIDLHKTVTVGFMDIELFNTRDLSYYCVFRGMNINNDEKKIFIELFDKFRSRVLMQHQDVFVGSTLFLKHSDKVLNISNMNGRIYIIDTQMYAF